ncbi:asparagine synthase (glutamine-hydrolyzing) [Bradyrhizobium elkanii]|uniref:asparagine synthase (glutamine-hydrolyzing) n=1 Tax=Bradyrhizobium elkanii TaxID=29448 RepID=UPI0004B3BDE3|nr:asparagine synthase (glutamine-hydrolyzing) [Bradyrhizobium elkanii]WLA85823.1 asparagine synthase (glutamine-hydrolyzing) [Bradyrhizobium elkanii]
MCGLAGFIDLKRRIAPDERKRIARAMGRAIEHRGPDDWGVQDEPDAGLVLSFRRLAIIDLSAAGHQPMMSASGRSVIAYNGEIYNADEIAKELEARGHRFRGHSDTEVMLEAFEQWGIDATLPKLVGMFAIAFYDRKHQRLTLIRDRLGKKPLYFGTSLGTFFFGSQPKSFFAHPDWSPEVDRKSVAAFMRFGYVPATRSIYSGVESLRPGERVDVVDGQVVTRTLYWNIRELAAAAQRKPISLDDHEAKARLQSLLDDAVRKRMVSDVPLGAFLSGGIDSSTVVASMQKSSRRPVKTFSIGFAEAEYDESQHAAAVAGHLGTDHNTLIVSPSDALEAIPLIPEYYDEPFGDASQVPTYLLCKLTRNHVSVALSGDGGDELMAGYTRYRIANEILGGARTIPRALRPAAIKALRNMPGAIWRALEPLVPKRYGRSPLSARMGKLADLMELGGEERVFQGIVGQWPDPGRFVRGAVHEDNAIWSGALSEELPDTTRRFQMLDTLTYLPDDILVKVDRASMAVALEARVPLLDHRLVEFTLGLPNRMLVRGGETKWLLRQVLYDHVPRSLLDRPKTGFMMPIDHWLRGPLRDWAEDLLDPKSMEADGILDPALIRETWDQHLSGQINWQYRLWCVLMFQAWKRRWMDPAGRAAVN